MSSVIPVNVYLFSHRTLLPPLLGVSIAMMLKKHVLTNVVLPPLNCLACSSFNCRSYSVFFFLTVGFTFFFQQQITTIFAILSIFLLLHMHRQVGCHLIYPEDATPNKKHAEWPWKYLNDLIRSLSIFLLQFTLDWPFISAVLMHSNYSESHRPAMEWHFTAFHHLFYSAYNLDEIFQSHSQVPCPHKYVWCTNFLPTSSTGIALCLTPLSPISLTPPS